jgi:hypothetical protein
MPNGRLGLVREYPEIVAHSPHAIADQISRFGNRCDHRRARSAFLVKVPPPTGWPAHFTVIPAVAATCQIDVRRRTGRPGEIKV